MNLFAFIGLWWTTAAVGAAAVAIPVIIHLINRKRFKIVEWAAMKFLLAAQKQTRKRMRIEQLLLLLTRMAILAFLVLAMAAVTGWAEDIWAFLNLRSMAPASVHRSHRVHHIIVIDASLSMNQKVDETRTAFDIAKLRAVKKINSNPSGDAYSVLLVKDSPTWLVGDPSLHARKVASAIEDAKPSHGNASVATAFSMISAKLKEAEGRYKGNQAIYFFTDMQRSNWLAAAPSTSELRGDDGREKATYLDLQAKAKAGTIFVDCGPSKDNNNLAVTSIGFDQDYFPYITTGLDLVLKATLENFGAEDKRDLRAEVLIGRSREQSSDAAMQMRVVDQQPPLVVPAHSKREIEFLKVKFATPGTYVVQVRLSDDTLEFDNTRSIVVTVRDTIPVLLVNGKSSTDRFERATEYLRIALNPFPPGKEEPGFPLRPSVVSSLQEVSEADLEKFDLVVWADVGHFRGDDVTKMQTHLRRGGGFIVALGDHAAKAANLYNELLYKDEQGLLPAELRKPIAAPAGHHFYLHNADPLAFEKPPLSVFIDQADKLTLQTARFRQYMYAVVPEGKARTVLSFATEVANQDKIKRDDKLPINPPAIVEWNPPLRRTGDAPAPARAERHQTRYRGKVILLTSSLNMDWSSWPSSPSYGAMMHELTRLAVSGRLREQRQVVGDALETYLPGSAEIEVTMHSPNKAAGAQKKKTLMVEYLNYFRWDDTDYSGVYRLEGAKGQEVPFAVNVPTAILDQKGTESDLTRIEKERLADLYPDWDFKIVQHATDVLLQGDIGDDSLANVLQPVGPEIANVLLLLVVVLLFAEVVMAWLFGHYSVTQGALTNAPPGPLSTTIAAGLAILSTILFAAGAFVVFNYWWTGNFLDFLPDILRAWFERLMEVPLLNPGEGSNWTYETQPWLFGLPRENWWAIGLTIGAIATIFWTYKAEAPRVSLLYKLLLGALRLYLILMVVWFVLPRPQVRYDRVGYPDLVLLIDTTRSMGEPDVYQNEKNAAREKELGDSIRDKLVRELPERIAHLEGQIAARQAAAQKDPEVKAEIDGLRQRLAYWEKQAAQINAGKWRPSRLQLIQAILAQPEPHWLKTMLTQTGNRKSKVHVFHLDVRGEATKLRDENGDAGELIDVSDANQLKRTLDAIARLEPVGNDSRLGTALKQVIDHYRASGLSNVVMLTDGVTTRDENVVEAGNYAAQKGIPLHFIGIGDELLLRDLRLHDMQVEPQIYVGDNALFEVRLSGKGYMDLHVDIILKVEDKNGKEIELKRLRNVKVDPSGQPVKLKFEDKPGELGKRKYVIQVEPPKVDKNDKPIAPANLRQERIVEIIDTKQINVLYVESQPRYEFRYLKFLMEREAPDDKKKKKSIDLKVFLLDADEDWHQTDKTALKVFPPTLEELNKYDIVVLGDIDPQNNKIKTRLADIKRFTVGEKENGQKATKPGGGVLFIAGPSGNPHKFKGTPLADILPVEPTTDAQKEVLRNQPWRPVLTQVGRSHPMFRFRQDEQENEAIFNKLAPLYWNSTGYKAARAAEVLAVHPTEKSAQKNDNLGPEHAEKHPLIVQQYVGTGRTMFLGFDESWRWRLRDDETKFNNFWIQAMRYLSRNRPMQTNLTLDRQIPYHPGDEIKVTVTFPESSPSGNKDMPKITEKTEVKVTVSYLPPDAPDGKEPRRESDVQIIQLSRVGNNLSKFEGKWIRTREGRYIFRLTDPDVSRAQPDNKKPSAEAIVELPPGELDRLRMNYQEMMESAAKTQGEFFTLATANEVLTKLHPGPGVTIVSNLPPTLLWNQWWVFVLLLTLITSEWILRKLKHLL